MRDDLNYENLPSRISQATGIAWIALVLSVIALLFALAAIMREAPSDALVTQRIEERAQQFGEEWYRDSALIESRAELLVLQARLEAEQEVRDAGEEITQVREQLRKAYEGAQQGAKQFWADLDGELEQMEREIEQNTAAGLSRLERIIEEMRVELQDDRQSKVRTSK